MNLIYTTNFLPPTPLDLLPWSSCLSPFFLWSVLLALITSLKSIFFHMSHASENPIYFHLPHLSMYICQSPSSYKSLPLDTRRGQILFKLGTLALSSVLVPSAHVGLS